jgi:hypothetical protein
LFNNLGPSFEGQINGDQAKMMHMTFDGNFTKSRFIFGFVQEMYKNQ